MHYFILPKDPMEELENNKRIAEHGLSKKEQYDQKKAKKEKQRNQEKIKEKTVRGGKKFGKGILYTTLIGVVIVGIAWLFMLAPNLPTTSAQGHTEDSPPAHIVDEPILNSVQSHMIEHADGSGAGGVIIQYNCDDYECVPDLVQKLTKLVEEYPNNVYLAPNNYDGKIILTRLGRREILDEFNQELIRSFIEQ